MGAWQEIVDYTVPSNTTSVVLDSFGTITKDDFVKVVFTGTNPTGSTASYRFYPNNETTDTNYHNQSLTTGSSGTTVAAGRGNINRLSYTVANETSSCISYIKLSENDRYNHFSNHTTANNGTALRVYFDYTTSSGVTFTSGITSFTLNSNVTNGLGTGSRIQIYKLAAEKVADITVGSNTTQVDISNLSIDKDSEYLLVSDILGNVAAAYDLMINDNTTRTNYYQQDIRATGSTAAAGRENNALYVYSELNTRSVAYSHIKLSNIGAYTSQTYLIRNTGSSGVRLQNYFVSSTSEAITSITKLNIVADATNGIGATSKFTLYKLY